QKYIKKNFDSYFINEYFTLRGYTLPFRNNLSRVPVQPLPSVSIKSFMIGFYREPNVSPLW
ncbi:hypothetical protein, partial [Bacillus safensis]|uniref:hypothetical protein n=1 Tax=Bacillus safensis TaxID=561879 RepID=UPI001BA86D94